MNVELLKRVANVIVARPSDFDMLMFEANVGMTLVINKAASCGTTACIGGWANVLRNNQDNPVVMDYGQSNPYEYYANLLDLKNEDRGDESDRLMLKSYWPTQYLNAYEDATTDAERAKVAYNRIHHFINTGGD